MAEADNPLRGITLTVSACLVFAVADVTAKYLSTGLPIIEITWIRYILFVGMAAVMAARAPGRIFRPRNPKLQVLRGLCVTGSSVLFVYGIREMTMAQASFASGVPDRPLGIEVTVLPGLNTPLPARLFCVGRRSARA